MAADRQPDTHRSAVPDSRPDAPPAPTSVRVAVVLLAVLAVLLLLNAGLSWFGRETLAEAIVRANPSFDQAEAERFVVVSVLPYLLIGLVMAASAVWLARRQAWARWTGLSAAVVLGLLTLTAMVTAGGITVVSLLVLVLSVGVVTSLVARTTTAWIPRLRAPR